VAAIGRPTLPTSEPRGAQTAHPAPAEIADLLPPLPRQQPAAEISPEEAPGAAAAGPTRADQLKTILAAVGVLAILFHGLRLFAAAAS
jgi:hypothetical protein